MSSKQKIPVTPAVRALRALGIDFESYQYAYQTGGGAEQAADELGVSLHQVIKTILFVDEQQHGLLVLMHGDYEIAAKQLAREIGVKQLRPANAKEASQMTGYLFGGTSPFGTKKALPVYAEASIQDLPSFWINGGKQGFQVRLSPKDLQSLNVKWVNVKTQKSN